MLTYLLYSNLTIEFLIFSENYLRAIERRPLLRQKAMVVYVEGLEDRNADVRCAACIALQILRVRRILRERNH